eukprot:scaffold14700_cov101-Isochrysis_galbana.AAC.1
MEAGRLGPDPTGWLLFPSGCPPPSSTPRQVRLHAGEPLHHLHHTGAALLTHGAQASEASRAGQGGARARLAHAAAHRHLPGEV